MADKIEIFPGFFSIEVRAMGYRIGEFSDQTGLSETAIRSLDAGGKVRPENLIKAFEQYPWTPNSDSVDSPLPTNQTEGRTARAPAMQSDRVLKEKVRALQVQ